MNCLHYRENKLFMDNVSLLGIVNKWQTPTYIYSANEIIKNLTAYEHGLKNHPHKLAFAVKANSNLHILKLIANQGWHFEVVSGGEMARVIKAGVDGNKILFTGVGKSEEEIHFALENNIFCFTVESANELYRIEWIAKKLNKIAPVAFRINPDVDSKSHPNISTGKSNHKFGMSSDQAFSLLDFTSKSNHLNLLGLACHIGSQITETETFLIALEKMTGFMTQLQEQGVQLQFLNMGGGLGIDYHSSDSPPIEKFTAELSKQIKGQPFEIILEPGRSIVGNAGVLISKVEYIKKTSNKNFVVLDCAMNDLMRPALYQGWHDMWPVLKHSNVSPIQCEVVGPVCETTDVLGFDRQLVVKEGDIVALLNCGAYGFSMSSNYNTRPRAAEVLIKDDTTFLIRKRETFEDLIHLELELE